MIPLKDLNPTRSRALVTLALIGICVVVYFFIQPSGQRIFRRSIQGDAAEIAELKFTFSHAAIPCEITSGDPLSEGELRNDECFSQSEDGSDEIFPNKSIYLAILYSMFLHGSILHIAGNMLFLWIFGNNIEDRMGIVPYVLFYLASGVAATFAHIAADPDSVIPVVGASGAIAGVMGMYLVLFPNVRIHSLIILGFFIFFRDISAKWLLGFWFVSQFFISPGSGVAWLAHVGGFVFGAVIGLIWRAVRGGPPASRHAPAPYRY